jgi:hypothetical protein
MNSCPKFLSACLLALLTQAAFAQSAPTLGAAAAFEVLGGTNVTCTDGSVVAGDVGVSPGGAVPFTNTGCTFTGRTPPATNAAAALARPAFLSAYAALQARPCTQMVPGTLATQNLAPGVYCLDAVAKAGTLTLTGPSNGVWIFRVDGALTGTNFSVVMAGGGQPCNVYWAPSAAATMTDSAFKGNLLAGDAGLGSITLTRGSLAGRVLANIAVTMTGTSIIGCGALAGGGHADCKDHDHDHDHHHKDHKDHGDHDKDDDRGHSKPPYERK